MRHQRLSQDTITTQYFNYFNAPHFYRSSPIISVTKNLTYIRSVTNVLKSNAVRFTSPLSQRSTPNPTISDGLEVVDASPQQIVIVAASKGQ